MKTIRIVVLALVAAVGLSMAACKAHAAEAPKVAATGWFGTYTEADVAKAVTKAKEEAAAAAKAEAEKAMAEAVAKAKEDEQRDIAALVADCVKIASKEACAALAQIGIDLTGVGVGTPFCTGPNPSYYKRGRETLSCSVVAVDPPPPVTKKTDKPTPAKASAKVGPCLDRCEALKRIPPAWVVDCEHGFGHCREIIAAGGTVRYLGGNLPEWAEARGGYLTIKGLRPVTSAPNKTIVLDDKGHRQL